MPPPALRRSSRVRRSRKTENTFSLLSAAVVITVIALLSTGSVDPTAASLRDSAAGELMTAEAASITAVSAVASAPTATFSAGVREKMDGLTVSNSGTIDASYTTATVATGSTQLATRVSVEVWASTALASCTTPVASVRGTWAAFPVLTGTLAAGASQFYCVKSTLSDPVGLTSNASVSATITTTLSRSNWTSVARSTVTHTFIDAPPSAPTRLTFSGTTSKSTTLNWAAATDDVGVTGYDIFRAGTLIGSTTSATSFIITGLTASTSYSYTVVARDGAGQTSAASPAATVTTLAVSAPSGWFQIVNTKSQLCIDASGAGTTNFTPLVQWTCNNPASANQQWSFSGPNAAGYYTVVPRHTTSVIWDVESASTSNAARIILYGPNSGTNQQWSVIAVGPAKYQFVARNSGKCMAVVGGATTTNAGFEQVTCNPSDPAQTFSLTAIASPPVATSVLSCDTPLDPSWMATFRWQTPTGVDLATLKYNLYVNGTKVPNTADGWNSYVQLHKDNVPASVPTGRSTVLVTRILPNGSESTIGTGSVNIQRFQTSTDRTFACG